MISYSIYPKQFNNVIIINLKLIAVLLLCHFLMIYVTHIL